MARAADELAFAQRDVDAVVMMIARQRDIIENNGDRGLVREEGLLLLRYLVQLLTLLENRRDRFDRELARLRPKAERVA
jgi:hypothetical protein